MHAIALAHGSEHNAACTRSAGFFDIARSHDRYPANAHVESMEAVFGIDVLV